MQYFTLCWVLAEKANSYKLRILAFIEQDDLIAKILKHVGLWESFDERPVANAPPMVFAEYYEEDYSQLPPSEYAYDEAC